VTGRTCAVQVTAAYPVDEIVGIVVAATEV